MFSSASFVSINWHGLPIFQLVSLCTSYFASRRRQDKCLGMHLLIQNPFWHKHLQSLPTMTGLHAPNVIWCSNRCHLSPSLPRTCSLKIISMIDLCTVLGILALHVQKESKSTRGMLWASSWRDFSTSSASLWAGCRPLPRLFMVSTLGVVIFWARFLSDVKLKL